MNNQLSTINNEQLTILLDSNAHNYAKQFASQQATIEKGKQVYLNTLAVYAVYTYLKCFPITTNLAQSDCWNPVLRGMFNVADLVLSNLGKLECCGLLPGEEVITIPAEVRDNRLGYLVVLLENELKEAALLGFIPSKAINYDTETVNISQIQPLDRLFDTLDSVQKQINLRQHGRKWLSGLFTPDWQPVETIMAGRVTRSLATNSDAALTTISRGKAISWEVNNIEEKVILILKITESNSEVVDICLQLYPDRESNNLPTSLSINILDETGVTCLSAIAKDSDDWIQLEFACHQGEVFNIELKLAEVSIIEKFVV
ncbi:conserved hypothetical protein [Hyella patelloides LEGE 07179]|uniref:DUF1822 domain-containing protein n=1 Tax=Hyella patelloides LEGE 07179 TaxID=945734 RepID=A0A563VIR4_9CYAN|nr:DUF1822 family protein [Hyella patelloides]VEP11312.1 conserved hypothetical protein [Hyella patelloides LEGE 07179]